MISHPFSHVDSSDSLKRVSASENDEKDHCGVMHSATKKPRRVTSSDSLRTSEPHPHDVLCGRGGFVNKHSGNIVFRRIVEANKDRYRSCQDEHKALLSQSIVEVIRNQAPPGRFLRQSSGGNGWVDAGETKALQKTSQALREGAVGGASVSSGIACATRSMQPTQQEMIDEVLRRALHGSTNRQGATQHPDVASSRHTKPVSQTSVSAGVQVSNEESTLSSPAMTSTMKDLSSKSRGTSSTFTSGEIQCVVEADTSQECASLDDKELDCHPIDASFFDIYTVSHHFQTSADFFPYDSTHVDDLHVYPLEFSFCEDHVEDVRPMDCIAFKSSSSGEEWEV